MSLVRDSVPLSEWSDMALSAAAGGGLGESWIATAGTEEWQRAVPESYAHAGQTFLHSLEELHGECQIASVDASEMTAKRFLEEFVAVGRPVRIRNALNMSNPAWQRLRPHVFRSSFNLRRVSVGGVPYSGTFNQPKLKMKMNEYMQYMQASTPDDIKEVARAMRERKLDESKRGKPFKKAVRSMERQHPRNQNRNEAAREVRSLNEHNSMLSNKAPPAKVAEWKRLLGWSTEPDHLLHPLYVAEGSIRSLWHSYGVSMPECIHPTRCDTPGFHRVNSGSPVPRSNNDMCPSLIWGQAYQVFLGKPMSGAPIHLHHGAVNLMPFGQKRWFMLPPTESLYTHKQIGRWLREDMPKLENAPLQCTQNAGDAMYVPDLWGHGLVNSRSAIAVAVEFLRSAGEQARHESLIEETEEKVGSSSEIVRTATEMQSRRMHVF